MEQTKNIIERTSKRSMTWRFQPPSAPYFGGAQESLVKSTKLAHYRALELERKGLRLPDEDMLRTVLFEVAGLLNSRPLTYVSSDPQNLRPLTPNDLLNIPPIAHRPVSKETTDTSLPKERFRYVQGLINLFWDLRIKQYLPSLIGRSKWRQKTRNF